MVPRSLPRLRIAIACNVDWNAMKGGDRARFCGQCCQTVYNVASLRPREVADLLERHGDRMPCLRLYHRPDGTVVTRSCLHWVTAGVRQVRMGALSIAALAVGFWSSVLMWRGRLHPAPHQAPVVSGAGPVPVSLRPVRLDQKPRIPQRYPRTTGGKPPRISDEERWGLRKFRRSGPVVTEEMVREALKPVIDDMKSRARLRLNSRVSVLLDVKASGRVRRADLDAPSDFPPDIGKMVIRSAKAARLPRNSEDYQTSFTVLFQGRID